MAISSSSLHSSWLRLVLALPFALMSALALFIFMAWMVNSEPSGIKDAEPAMMFDMVMQEPEQQTQRRQRQAPKPPEVPAQPQAIQPTTAQVASSAQIDANLALNMDMAFSDYGVSINMPSLDGVGADQIGQQQQAMPLYRVEAQYPARALQRRMEGFVVMTFTINEQGQPEDIEVLQAEPSKIFVRPAVQALRNWKYQPKLEAGKAVKQPNQQVKIEFKISQS